MMRPLLLAVLMVAVHFKVESEAHIQGNSEEVSLAFDASDLRRRYSGYQLTHWDAGSDDYTAAYPTATSSTPACRARTHTYNLGCCDYQVSLNKERNCTKSDNFTFFNLFLQRDGCCNIRAGTGSVEILIMMTRHCQTFHATSQRALTASGKMSRTAMRLRFKLRPTSAVQAQRPQWSVLAPVRLKSTFHRFQCFGRQLQAGIRKENVPI